MFSRNEGPHASNNTSPTNKTACHSPKVHFCEDKRENNKVFTDNKPDASQNYTKGERNNNIENRLCSGCSEKYVIPAKQNSTTTAATKLDISTSTQVPATNIPHSANSTWESLPPTHRWFANDLSVSGPSAPQSPSSISRNISHTTRSPPSSAASDSSSSTEYAPLTYHEMSKLSTEDANMSTSSSSSGEDVTGSASYSDVLQRSPLPASTSQISKGPAHTSAEGLRNKRASVEQWMNERNTPNQLKKLSNL